MSEPTASEEREAIAEYLENCAKITQGKLTDGHDPVARAAVSGAVDWIEILAREIRNGAHREEQTKESDV